MSTPGQPVPRAIEIANLVNDAAKASPAYKQTLAGTIFQSISPALLLIPPPAGPIAAAISAALGTVINVFAGLFGNKFQSSFGVRVLLMYFEFYVLGIASVDEAKDVHEDRLGLAYTWYTAVLGVPVYDFHRLHALMGVDTSQPPRPLGNSDTQRVAAFINFEDTLLSGLPIENVYKAVQIAKQFSFNGQPGSWREFKPAEYWQLPSTTLVTEFTDADNQDVILEEDNLINDTKNYLTSLSSGWLPVVFIAVSFVLFFPLKLLTFKTRK